MNHSLDAAAPARSTLLGLLLAGPRHGYDLARDFAPTTPIGDVVHLSPSHLYALLGHLERDGLIVGEREASGSRPPRRVYRLTDDGHALVQRWIDEPVSRPRDMHLSFPLKFLIACRVDPVRARALVEHQRALFAGYLRDLEHHVVGVDPAPEDPFATLMRAGRIGRTRAALEWLERCAEAIEDLRAMGAPETGSQGTGVGRGAAQAHMGR